MNLSAILTAVRYILVGAGGFLVAKFSLDAEQVNAIITGLLTIIPAVIGVVQTVKNKTKVEAATTVLTQAPSPVSQAQIEAAAIKVKE
jgi:hypothetical protein